MIKLTTELAKIKKHSLVIKLIVEDTGIGIEKEKQQDIFLQFKRLTPSYQGIYKGAGLGLTIVKKFLDELQGEIYIESQIGIGTKFTCLIPLKRSLLDDNFGSEKITLTRFVKENSLTQEFKITNDTNSKEINSTKKRILVVEDQMIASIVLKNILVQCDCEVDVASDGQTAVNYAKKHDYNLIFMDIGLPDMDGYEVTKQIRLHELNSITHVPIVALTAHIDDENRQRCINVGMNSVFVKPLNKEITENILNSFTN